MHRRLVTVGKEVCLGLGRPPHVATGVLVLGMHRSGTSALTRVVNLLGVPLGHGDDVSAHWERSALTNFQEELLYRLGGSWDSPPPLPRGWERRARLLPMVGRGRSLFAKHYGGLPSWVWKDPRTSLTLPFWRRVLGRPMPAIVIHRHPLEVWRSLEARDGFEKSRSLSLWERYNGALLAEVAGRNTLVVSYGDLVSAPVAFAQSLRIFLLAHGVRVAEVPEQQLTEFVDSRLRHAAYPDDEVGPDPDVTQSQRALARLLRALQLRPIADAA